ncbi:MAG: hypothetical protein HZR80_05670 [Candidatus Heimdallarchaeota archaeon]
MHIGPLRWGSSEGVFLFRVPEEERILSSDVVMLLSSSLYAIQVFLEHGEIKINNEQLAIIRINFHPPFSEEIEEDTGQGFVIHISLKDGICFQSLFVANEITPELSEFEKAFLDSVVNNLLETLAKEGRNVSDIPFLRDREVIEETESMLHEIDTKYKSLVASWSLAVNPDCEDSQFEFSNVLYNGKIKIEELFYDLGERSIETFDQLMLSKEEKIILYKIAKSLVSLSGLIYERQETNQQIKDKLKFYHSEILLESLVTKKKYRLDVRSYDIEGESYCDLTIMS